MGGEQFEAVCEEPANFFVRCCRIRWEGSRATVEYIPKVGGNFFGARRGNGMPVVLATGLGVGVGLTWMVWFKWMWRLGLLSGRDDTIADFITDGCGKERKDRWKRRG